MYLTASKINSNNFLNSWKGKKGRFIRTFGINTTRNNNEWMVTWESIKQHIGTAINRPGIEYEKCQEGKCDLDHVEAESFEGTIIKQKPFERTKIIDYILDEENESVDLVHEVNDTKDADEFFEKVKNGEIQYVSAMIWPATGGYDVSGKGRADQPIIDAYHWKYVHHAFLKDNPAYGKDVAQVKTTCEGDNCQVQLLSAKLIAETTSAPGVSLDPLKEIPLLYRHNDSVHLISASDSVKKLIKEKQDSGITITDKELSAAFSECGESNTSKNDSGNDSKNSAESSFKTCTCDTKQNKMPDDDNKVKDLESKLKATETEKKELESKLKSQDEDKEKQVSSKKARYSKLFAQSDSEEDSKKMYAKLKATTEDKDELKAMDDEYENHTKSRKSQSEDPEKKELQASNKAMAAQLAAPMIASLVAIRKDRMPDAELTEYENALKSKSFIEVQTAHSNEAYLINALSSKDTEVQSTGYTKFDFNGQTKSLTSKSQSLEEIAGDVN